jgi:aryl-alcohol dehydrogenase-like predicted oxidoreductase
MLLYLLIVTFKENGIMQTRQLGAHGPRVSEVGLGCMGMSNAYGHRDESESIATIHAALDAGVNFVNTGDFYGMGHNEMLLAEALKNRREQAFISVKFGAQRDPQGNFVGMDMRPGSVKNFAAYSLQRLGTDVIDLYQPARVAPDVPIEETVGAIKELIEQGYVRYLGLSEANPEILRRAHKVHPVAALEVEYALATRVIERELLATARELGIAVVAYGALGRGLLSGQLDTQNLGGFRMQSPRFMGDNLHTNLEQVEKLRAIAEAKGCTPAQLAIAWVMHQGQDIITLIGTSTRSRLHENLKAPGVSLSPSELENLSVTFPEDCFVGERYPDAQMSYVVQ